MKQNDLAQRVAAIEVEGQPREKRQEKEWISYGFYLFPIITIIAIIYLLISN